MIRIRPIRRALSGTGNLPVVPVRRDVGRAAGEMKERSDLA